MEIIVIALSSLTLVLLIILLSKATRADVKPITDSIQLLLQRELRDNRTELAVALKQNREELSNGLNTLTQKLDEKLTQIIHHFNLNAKDNRDELTRSLQIFSETFTSNVKEFNDLQRQKFDAMAIKQDDLVKATELRLEKMRETVDEKLHKTLEERLGQSFKLVSERLEAVQKGLGEMHLLANGVGDLKRVLSNVKTRGILGEIQLGNILEQIMAPEQYEANVKTRPGANDMVEYAIKLPGRDDNGQMVYLPIDAKFPQEDYLRLQTAYDLGDTSAIDTANKALTQAIKKFARDIRDKYLAPPHTTDFGIMFLPIEGLFAEVVRQPELVTLLQRDYKIIVTGPTSLAAKLNSLQMGFKTLAIQKRSSEVWQILGAVKSEFGKFGLVLEKAQRKITEANNELDTLVGTRTKMMLSKLKQIEELPTSESIKILDGNSELN